MPSLAWVRRCSGPTLCNREAQLRLQGTKLGLGRLQLSLGFTKLPPLLSLTASTRESSACSTLLERRTKSSSLPHRPYKFLGTKPNLVKQSILPPLYLLPEFVFQRGSPGRWNSPSSSRSAQQFELTFC